MVTNDIHYNQKYTKSKQTHTKHTICLVKNDRTAPEGSVFSHVYVTQMTQMSYINMFDCFGAHLMFSFFPVWSSSRCCYLKRWRGFACDFGPLSRRMCGYICFCLNGTSIPDSFLFLRAERSTAAGGTEWVNISSLIEKVRIIIFCRLILMPRPEGLLTGPWKIMQNKPRTRLCVNASSYENATPHKWNICFWFTDEL